MKKWYCPNCARKSISDQKIKIKLCPCGEYMKEIEQKEGIFRD
jgi:hypothetical protein